MIRNPATSPATWSPNPNTQMIPARYVPDTNVVWSPKKTHYYAYPDTYVAPSHARYSREVLQSNPERLRNCFLSGIESLAKVTVIGQAPEHGKVSFASHHGGMLEGKQGWTAAMVAAIWNYPCPRPLANPRIWPVSTLIHAANAYVIDPKKGSVVRNWASMLEGGDDSLVFPSGDTHPANFYSAPDLQGTESQTGIVAAALIANLNIFKSGGSDFVEIIPLAPNPKGVEQLYHNIVASASLAAATVCGVAAAAHFCTSANPQRAVYPAAMSLLGLLSCAYFYRPGAEVKIKLGAGVPLPHPSSYEQFCETDPTTGEVKLPKEMLRFYADQVGYAINAVRDSFLDEDGEPETASIRDKGPTRAERDAERIRRDAKRAQKATATEVEKAHAIEISFKPEDLD